MIGWSIYKENKSYPYVFLNLFLMKSLNPLKNLEKVIPFTEQVEPDVYTEHVDKIEVMREWARASNIAQWKFFLSLFCYMNMLLSLFENINFDRCLSIFRSFWLSWLVLLCTSFSYSFIFSNLFRLDLIFLF